MADPHLDGQIKVSREEDKVSVLSQREEKDGTQCNSAVTGSNSQVCSTPELAESSVKRGEPKSDGLYIKGTLNGVDALYCVDTGASSTIVSTRVYEEISKTNRPILRPTRPHCAADGRPLKSNGKGKFTVGLGDLLFEREWTVANITDDVLLGADILQNDSFGPANLLLSDHKMVWKGTSIPLLVYSTPQSPTRKVYAADHYIIPPMSEMVIDVYVDCNSGEEGDGSVLTEPAPQVAETMRLAMALCLVNVKDNTSVKVRVINPYPDPTSVKQDTVLGSATPYGGSPQVLLETEGSSDSTCEVRRAVLEPIKIDEASRLTRSVGRQNKAAFSSVIPEHLHELYEETVANKSESHIKEAVTELLANFADTFSKDSTDLGLTNLGEHEIDTGDARPVRQPPRRTPLAFEGEDQAALEKLQQQGSVRPSSSPWASPIVLVRKKDGSIRPCVDYRRLNLVTKPDAFPLPRTEDCLDAMAGSVLFSTLDITSAYNQIPVRKEDIPKTAFITKYGFFEYTTMPFGLCNAPATFQRVMELALRGLQWSSCLIYLDDIIIFGKNLAEHMARLNAVLAQLRAAGLKLSPKSVTYSNQRWHFWVMLFLRRVSCLTLII